MTDLYFVKSGTIRSVIDERKSTIFDLILFDDNLFPSTTALNNKYIHASLDRMKDKKEKYKLIKAEEITSITKKASNRQCYIFCKKEDIHNIESMLLDYAKKEWPTYELIVLSSYFKPIKSSDIQLNDFNQTKSFYWDTENDFMIIFPRNGRETQDIRLFKNILKQTLN